MTNKQYLDKHGNTLNNGDAVRLHRVMCESDCLIRNGKLYIPEHYVTYENVEKGEYLPKSIEDIEPKYLEKIDCSIFKEFPYCDNTI